MVFGFTKLILTHRPSVTTVLRMQEGQSHEILFFDGFKILTNTKRWKLQVGIAEASEKPERRLIRGCKHFSFDTWEMSKKASLRLLASI